MTNRIGFGTWQLGGENTFAGRVTGWGKTDLVEAKRAIHHALDNGITFFDTADTYGNGISERILGETIGNEKEAIICTKFGNLEDKDGKAFQDFSEKHLRQCVENSLKRLKRDCIDALLLHSPPDDFDWLNYDKNPYQNLIQEGKIKAYGVSSKSLKGAENVLKCGFGTWIEAIYNALDRRAEEKILPLCQAQNTNFIARVPLASGFLNPQWLKSFPTFSDNDIRASLPVDAIKWFVESVRDLSFLDELNGGMSVSGLRFCISNPAVSVCIPGIRKISHAQDAILASKLGALPTEIIKKIEQTVPDIFPAWR